jgi:hypothetical protein
METMESSSERILSFWQMVHIINSFKQKNGDFSPFGNDILLKQKN